MAEQPKSYLRNADHYAKHSSSLTSGQKSLSKTQVIGKRSIAWHRLRRRQGHSNIGKMLPNRCGVGIENSEAIINLTRQTFPQEAYQNLSTQRMNAHTLTFQSKLDRVFSNAALHWIIYHKSVLHGVQRSLKSGGRLLFSDGGKGRCSRNTLSPRRSASGKTLEKILLRLQFSLRFLHVRRVHGLVVWGETKTWTYRTCAKGHAASKQRRLSWVDQNNVAVFHREAFYRTKRAVYRGNFQHLPWEAFFNGVGAAHVRMMRLEVEANKPALAS